MRSKEATRRTLQLRRETLRKLSVRDLGRVAGGTDDSTGAYDPETAPKTELWDHDTMSTASRFC